MPARTRFAALHVRFQILHLAVPAIGRTSRTAHPQHFRANFGGEIARRTAHSDDPMISTIIPINGSALIQGTLRCTSRPWVNAPAGLGGNVQSDHALDCS